MVDFLTLSFRQAPTVVWCWLPFKPFIKSGDKIIHNQQTPPRTFRADNQHIFWTLLFCSGHISQAPPQCLLRFPHLNHRFFKLRFATKIFKVQEPQKQQEHHGTSKWSAQGSKDLPLRARVCSPSTINGTHFSCHQPNHSLRGSIGPCLGRFQVTEKFSCWQSIAMAVPNRIKGALCVPNMLSLLNHPLHLVVPRKEIGQCLQVSTVAQ